MDALGELLGGVRARSALITRNAVEPGLAVRLAADAALSLVGVVRGQAWVSGQHLAEGDVAIVRGPGFTVSEDRVACPTRVLTEADYCARSLVVGTRECGPPDAPVQVVSGAYTGPEGVSGRLLAALPEVAVVRGTPVLAQVAAEIAADRPGQQAVLDRMLDLALVTALRSWFDATGHVPLSPVVDTALRAMADDPAHPWTVAVLAERVGLSRAALARRFTAETGTPPMAHLADLRLSRTAALLRDSDETLAAIARKVGYANAYALSTAFKRANGTSPAHYRALGAPPVPRATAR
ncbi:AraC family transcriptional regulator [Actinokineospora pegani]|uniref:AraC family transcriptional regulator n=1 Tax=Actinokineospora pegani TaxID=2654637 RepID=UPI0012EAD2B4|nr:AraC family transcriptional regulator [Actinokineospora pegani]